MVQQLRYNIYPFILMSLIIHGFMFFSFLSSEMPLSFKFASNKDQAKVIAVTFKEIINQPKVIEKKSLKKSSILKPDKIKTNKKPITQTLKTAQAAMIKGKKSKKLINAYLLDLKSFLEKNKKYPRMAVKLRHSGVVKVKVSILSDGTFKNIKIVDGSQFDSLNKGTLAYLKKLGSFKPLPKEFYPKEDFIIPIDYKLSSRR